MSLSCSSTGNMNDNGSGKPAPHEITAAFKNADRIDSNNWMLIFRRIDNCQYILFSLNSETIQSIPYMLIRHLNENPEINNDYVNLMFDIKYTGETIEKPETNEVIVHADSIKIEKNRSSRFLNAGFEDDTEAENFILDLKKFIRDDEAEKISTLVRYPINVKLSGQKKIIRHEKEFINRYPLIFNKSVKDAILQQSLADIKSDTKGLILGNGEILLSRINSRIMITAIKNN